MGKRKEEDIIDTFMDWSIRIGQRIREIRSRYGITQTQVAKMLGVNQAVVVRIERGKNLTLRTVFNLQKIIGGGASIFGIPMCIDDSPETLVVGVVNKESPIKVRRAKGIKKMVKAKKIKKKKKAEGVVDAQEDIQKLDPGGIQTSENVFIYYPGND